MNNDGGRINYSVGLENAPLRTGAAESKRILAGISNTAVEEGNRIDETFKKIGAAAAGVFALSQLKSFAFQVANVRGEFQKLEIAFKTMLGSEEKATALMQQLVKTAATTPFGMSDIANSAKQLLAYGLEADKVNDTLIRLGDIAAGLSIPINDLSYLYGTTMVQGRLYTQDLNQFLGRGIPLVAELAKQFNVTEGEVKGLVEQGKVGFPEVQKAIENLTNEGSKFGGLMAAQSKTISGQISNIEDQIEQMFNELGQSSEGAIAGTLGLVSSLIDHWETIGKIILTVIATYGAYKAAVIAVAAAHKLMAIWETVQAFLSLTKYVKTAKDAMLLFNIACNANPLGLVLSVIAAAVTAFTMFKKSSDKATEAMKAQQQEIEDFNRQVSESAGRAISSYKQLQTEYQKCKTAHEKREWIKENKRRFDELGISVSDVNTAENVFVKNTALMMDAFKKRAEAAAWQSKIDAEYAKRVERQLQLEQKSEAFVAGGEVRSSSHTTEGGNEYVNRDGKWVYTEQGAREARKKFQESMKNDPVLSEIDARINKYSEKMAAVSTDFKKLFNQAGSSTEPKKTDKELKKEESDAEKKKKEQQQLADEAAERQKKIQEYSESVQRETEQAEFDIRQAQINALENGYSKTVKQVQLNYDRLKAENKRREEDMISDLKEKKLLEWMNDNPKATKEQQIKYTASLNLSRSDLSTEQQGTLKAYDAVAEKSRVDGNSLALEAMLKDVQTYEQKRQAVEKEYAEKRNALYETDADGKPTDTLREGVTQGNVDELDRQAQEALNAVDEQFAQRQETYQAWCDEIASYSLDELKKTLDEAKKELDKLEKNGGSGAELSQARAKVQTAEKAVAKEQAKADVRPDKRSIKEWQDLYQTLNECTRSFEDIGNAVGGTVGEIISAAGQIASSTMQMINGIVQLVQMSSTAMSSTSLTASTAIKTVEKASVILAVISAALQVATAIANLFNDDAAKQKEIERLQSRIDQLQWELDHADIIRLQENSGKAIERVRKALSETYLELLRSKLAVNDYAGAWSLMFGKIRNNSQLLEKTAQKLATAYGQIAYTADKALGGDKYENARQQLENISKQQILINDQIKQEKSKKKTDKGKIAEWEQKIEELGEQAVKVINEMVEDIIGGTSSDIASDLSDAFFEAFQAGEDYAEAWGDKVNEIVADIMKRMLVSKFLEEPLGDVFNKYKEKWFKNGNFQGLQTVIDSMNGFAADLNAVGEDFAAIWENLPDSVKNMFTVTDEASREASQKGITTASQETVDELNGRATAIQGHTYSINENTRLLLASVNLILQSVLNIERHSEAMADSMSEVRLNVKEVKDTVNDIAMKGLKLK